MITVLPERAQKAVKRKRAALFISTGYRSDLVGCALMTEEMTAAHDVTGTTRK